MHYYHPFFSSLAQTKEVKRSTQFAARTHRAGVCRVTTTDLSKLRINGLLLPVDGINHLRKDFGHPFLQCYIGKCPVVTWKEVFVSSSN